VQDLDGILTDSTVWDNPFQGICPSYQNTGPDTNTLVNGWSRIDGDRGSTYQRPSYILDMGRDYEI
jgi:hypothetical protein